MLFYHENAAPTERGGALYVPAQGRGRIDNPSHYGALYVGNSAAGVCAEVFYRGNQRQRWEAQMLQPLSTGDRRVLAWYDLPDDAPICNLDAPDELRQRNLRPSLVITRDYEITRRWALAIWNERRWLGVAWWSYCDARWVSVGLWRHDAITAYGIEELSLDHSAIVAAADIMAVDIVGRHR